jgi:DNA replication and repair protein RecF
VFAPEDLSLVRGEPAGRRRFLDELLCQLTPRLAGVIVDYDRVLRQRNTLLKTVRTSRAAANELATLDVWDERLIALGVGIMSARAELVSTLRSLVGEAYVDIAGPGQQAAIADYWSIAGETQPVTVPSDPEISEIFRAALTRVRSQEFDRGVSLVGPHRDDVVFTLNDLVARTHASHGESWSLALALKLASARVLKRNSPTGDPVLILDDVFAELDRSRRSRLSKAIEGYEQVLITAAVLEDVPPELASNIVHINSGAVVGGPVAP